MLNQCSISSISILLIFSLLLMSCAASQHAGVTYVNKPSMKETNEALWLSYWQDQFDAYNGNVVQPSTVEYNQSAINAYQRAKMEWDEKVFMASTNSSILLYGGLTLGVILAAVLVTSSAKASIR
jgi:hypothetical protein